MTVRAHLASLVDELNKCESAKIIARIWCRDDDAASDTLQLRRLAEIAHKAGITVGLAVIPERADDSLASFLVGAPFCVWQHGWGHHHHKSGEFGDDRGLEAMTEDALKGQAALDRVFGPAGWERVFVPPFHALSVPFKGQLAALGYRGLSAGHPLTPPDDSLPEINAELDVVDWQTRTMLPPAKICAMLVEALADRREGRVPRDRPIGVLMHHLVFDSDAWGSIETILEVLKSHPAVELVSADQLFPKSLPGSARAHMGAASVEVVVTSCGRQDLLERTLDSFLKYNRYPIQRILVVEDGDGSANAGLAKKYDAWPFEWLAMGTKAGQIAAIDAAYRTVNAEYVFHCEDDWEFTAPGFIEKSLSILRQNEEILQVWIRALDDTNAHPLFEHVFATEETTYRVLEFDFKSDDRGPWHGFSFNPGLRRYRDYQRLGSFGSLDPRQTLKAYEVEARAGQYYRERGLISAILNDNDARGYVRHIGGDRHVPDRLEDPQCLQQIASAQPQPS
jgi:hypothetical protein